VNGIVRVNNLHYYNMHCVLSDLGSFTNLVICICILKIQIIKLAYILEIDCILTYNNQFSFCLKENRKIMDVYGYGVYWTALYIPFKLKMQGLCHIL